MSVEANEIYLDWPVRCSRFNHGWLRNVFLQSLKAALKVARGNVGRDDSKDANLRLVEDWLENEGYARQLIASFVDEMSPAVFFATTPLSKLQPDDASFFRNLSLALWFERHGISDKLEMATEALNSASNLIGRLRESNGSKDALDPEYIVSVHNACLRLADALSGLPRTILL